MTMFHLVTAGLFAIAISVPIEDQGACNCDWRYFKHYEAKNCTPVYDDATSCKCPKYFQCPELKIDAEVCKLNGVSYDLGSSVNGSNHCQICDCRKDYLSGKASIDCIGIECGSAFRGLADGCYYVYERDQCCPNTKCEADIQPSEKVCAYGGKNYRLGQKIYPDDDPCMTCFCTENWTGVNNASCESYNCELEKDVHKLARKCIPIYHEKTCCPIEYHCPDEEISSSITKTTSAEVHKCSYNGKSYGVGEVLDIKHPTNCVTCSCQSPPDFTCVHRSCPGPPNDDYKNCDPLFVPGTCCTKYNCTLPKEGAEKL